MPDVLTISRESAAAAKVGPRVYRKHLLPYGSWLHPSDPARKLEITPDFLARLKANFDAAVLDTVPVPGKHTDDWKANHGQTIGLEVHPDKGLYALLSVDAETDTAIAEKKLHGVSAGLYEDYLDKRTGEKRGPVLRHVSLTNVPYIKGMDGFEKVANLSDDDEIVFLTAAVADPPAPPAPPVPNPKPEEAEMTKEEMLAALKAEGIDVEALTAKAATTDSIREALKAGGIELAEDADAAAVTAAVKGLKTQADESVTLSERVAAMEKDGKRKAAEAIVAPYIQAGKITQAEKDDFVDLAEENPERAKKILAKLTDNILLEEIGTTREAPSAELAEDEAEKEIERIAKQGAATGAIRVRQGAFAGSSTS